MKKIFVTGAAGFIGSSLCKTLAEAGDEVIGIDNLNSYYDVELKYGRLKALLGIDKGNIQKGGMCSSGDYPNFRFFQGDIVDYTVLSELFVREKFDVVCNLAAQAGVRYSLVNPQTYGESNLIGFLNILEVCRHYKVDHLVYASSSSVYGKNEKSPFSESDRTDAPVSLYAATKKANELMAYSYSSLYGLHTTGLRFFTVYGPWGRPDMAPYLFMDSIANGREIRVFNHGDMKRDFTYIDDIVDAVVRVIHKIPETGQQLYELYNVGHSEPVDLMDFIRSIENVVGKKAICRYEDMQPGDVPCTYADVDLLKKAFGYVPHTNIYTGMTETYKWYCEWEKIQSKTKNGE